MLARRLPGSLRKHRRDWLLCRNGSDWHASYTIRSCKRSSGSHWRRNWQRKSPAAEKNIRPGDVIVEVQNQAVHSPDDVAKRIDADSKAGKKVEVMLLNRGGDLAFVAVRLS